MWGEMKLENPPWRIPDHLLYSTETEELILLLAGQEVPWQIKQGTYE